MMTSNVLALVSHWIMGFNLLLSLPKGQFKLLFYDKFDSILRSNLDSKVNRMKT